ncbi:uncharacterized protein FIESC28_02828 [Fusarium coffeatum]|uniref:Uncharacterized protein n=1 Tax=Fusarium coffeatum TaxID=231269 RepID=A0A366S619_9HYPO|nr:uncharacterized protein FIESC28_02828 [Fusarium coffeatum]RBR24338.1 hypothetical protein FIESC28_02828 [Fusarium coffeatum]
MSAQDAVFARVQVHAAVVIHLYVLAVEKFIRAGIDARTEVQPVTAILSEPSDDQNYLILRFLPYTSSSSSHVLVQHGLELLPVYNNTNTEKMPDLGGKIKLFETGPRAVEATDVPMDPDSNCPRGCQKA